MTFRYFIHGILVGCSLIVLGGCNQPVANLTDTPAISEKSTLDMRTPTTQPVVSVIDTPQAYSICSPLADLGLAELKDFISNPFVPALIADARDGGHHGTDFAYYTHPRTGEATRGAPIQSMYSGRVASVSSGRVPYGNLIMIETSIARLPADIVAIFGAYPHATPSVPETHLTCPTYALDQKWQFENPSIYILYAHMDQPSRLVMGSQVTCGDRIGLVGNTGKSGNPHLHLEVRFGPGDASFDSLAHYSGDATAEEMAAYCTWRVSGIFQPVDPMKLIGIGYLK